MWLKEVKERKEKVEKIYFETERKKSSKCKENIGVFPLGRKYRQNTDFFPREEKVYYYIIYIFGHKPPENLF